MGDGPSVRGDPPARGPERRPAPDAGRPGPTDSGPARRVVLFTGHQVDQPGRPSPRFPADQEGTARDAIRAAVAGEQAAAGGAPVVGLAGGASGGDILFHEACRELGVPTRLYLGLPPESYVAESVRPGGESWVGRFDALYERLPHRVLPPTAGGRGRVWERTNRWLLEAGLAEAGAGENAALIALWDGKGGDGTEGADDMVRQASAQGVRTVVLDTNVLFGLSSTCPPAAPSSTEGRPARGRRSCGG